MSHQEFSHRPTSSLQTLKRRSQLLGKIRDFFEDRDFIHVETPLLSQDTVIDRYIEPVAVPKAKVADGGIGDWYLQTSPEFAMKRILAAGADSIYQICKAFRKGEAGRRHNPEFTMLEWYRVGDDLEAGMELLADFALEMFAAKQVEMISYRDAFVSIAQIDPFEATLEELKQFCLSIALDVSTFSQKEDRDTWLNLILSEVVEPQLGVDVPQIVFHYPASQSALAEVVTAEGFEVAERFELYVDGVELANGYHELLDAVEFVSRNEKVNLLRESDGNAPLPVQSYLLDAMKHGLPPCSGVALGVDRLMMVLMGATSIDDVIAFPLGRA